MARHAPPFVPGVEGAERILAIGEGVKTFRVGDRVAWVYVPGSYAEQIVAPADALVPIPNAIDDVTAAAVMMQGITASHFATQFYTVRQGDIALLHAAAGGVGTLLTQIIKLRGGQLFEWIQHGDLKVTIGKRYPLREAAQAHADMESRRSIGKLLLMP